MYCGMSGSVILSIVTAGLTPTKLLILVYIIPEQSHT